MQRRRRCGQLVAVRRGVYATAEQLDTVRDDARAAHLLQASARRLVVRGDVLVSHESAALLRRMRVLAGPPAEPRLTVARPLAGPALRLHDLATSTVPASDLQLLLPLVPATSDARTVADCCRALSTDAAVVLADSALARGVDRSAVLQVIERCARWPGARTARDVLTAADGRAESALESLARRWFEEQGLPRPDLQLRLCEGATGLFVARVDFAWLQHRTVCEVDGRLKYAVEAGGRPGDGRADPLFAEKLREDAVRELGLEVVRGYWSDGADRGTALAARLRRAFARGDARVDRATYGVVGVPGRSSA